MSRIAAVLLASLLSPAVVGEEVIIAVTSGACGPCRRFHSDYAADASIAGGRSVVFVDADRDRAEARRLRARTLPTFIVTDGGKEVSRTAGYGGPESLKAWLGGR